MALKFGKVLSIIYWLTLLVIVAAGFYMMVPRYRHYCELKKKRAALECDNEARQLEIARMQRMRLRFTEDPEFVERIARDNRRVRPGEITFIFGDEEGNLQQ